jgi:hypothetical protein
MGNSVTVQGELDIVPPLTWNDLKKNPGYRPDAKYHDMRILFDEETVDTDKGELVCRTGLEVGYGGSSTGDLRYSMIEKQLTEIVGALPKGTELKGWLDCRDEQGDVWRFAVRDGKVVEVKPELVWPEWMS